MPSAKTPRYTITALQRGLHLLTLVGNAPEALAAGDIARLSKLHPSTVHRFLANLEQAGFLVREDETHRYQLGPLCVTLGRKALDRMDVRRVCLPYLQELNRTTRENVHLTVRQQLTAVYVEKMEALEPLRIFSQVGAQVPLHCTGVGKVLLAFARDDERSEILSRLELKRFTPNTITSVQQLESELQRIRRQGFATDLEEHEIHIRCIAGPLWDHTGRIRAAFSITGPVARMTKQRLREMAPLITRISQAASERLGYQPQGEAARRLERRASTGA